MAAKEKWLSGDVPGARAVLMEAFAANHDNENIWLAAVKLEWENNEFERARMLLSKARTRADTERVWLKSALLERETGQVEEECNILDAALTRYPLFDKLWMMRAQLEERQGGDRAKEFYRKGLRAVPQSVPLWIMLARHEEKGVSVAKARGVLELARLKSPKTAELWLAAVRLERRHDGSGGGTALSLSAGSVAGEGEGSKLAVNLMAKALQDCPAAGILWAEDIAMAPRPRQKARAMDALKRCDNDPHVVVAVSTIFMHERKYVYKDETLCYAVPLRCVPGHNDTCWTKVSVWIMHVHMLMTVSSPLSSMHIRHAPGTPRRASGSTVLLPWTPTSVTRGQRT